MTKNKTEKKLTEKELEICKRQSKEWEKSRNETVEILKKTQNEVTKERNENNKLTETLQRLQADFENYKKRVEKEQAEFCKFANKELIIELLSVLDRNEIVLKQTKNEELKNMYNDLWHVLEKKGLKKIKAEKFDPYLHEALLSEESDKEPGIVLEELQKGYMLNDKVIRHSKVKVSKGKKLDKKK